MKYLVLVIDCREQSHITVDKDSPEPLCLHGTMQRKNTKRGRGKIQYKCAEWNRLAQQKYESKNQDQWDESDYNEAISNLMRSVA